MQEGREFLQLGIVKAKVLKIGSVLAVTRLKKSDAEAFFGSFIGVEEDVVEPATVNNNGKPALEK